MFEVKFFTEDFFSITTVVPYTLTLALLILMVSVLAGGIVALADQHPIPVLKNIIAVFLSFLRGTPLLVQLYLAYFSLPAIVHALTSLAGVPVNPNDFNPVITVVVAYSLYFAAFQSEIIKGAMLSVGYGQVEAAQAMGFTFVQMLSRVVVPQAFIEALPNLFNSYLSIIKSLSLAFLVTVVDILAKAKLESALNFRYLESYAAAAAVYWLLCTILTIALRRYEGYLRKKA